MAVDAVFGELGRAMLTRLQAGGTYVQLGYLAGPHAVLEVSAKDLWAKHLTMRAFRGAVQLAHRPEAEQAALMNWLVQLFNEGTLKLPSGALQLQDVLLDVDGGDSVQGAISRAVSASRGQVKQVLFFKR